MRIAMVAGESSSDYLGAGLIRTLKERNVEISVSGICGPEMIKEGAEALYPIESITSIGLEGLFRRIVHILRIRNNLVRELLACKPDLYIGIDAPDFNIAIERKLRRAGISTIQYVAPSIWAWRGYRIHKIKKAVSKLLTIYPFESSLYETAAIPFTYVGHPLADEINIPDMQRVRQKFGYGNEDTVVAILPGSRISEVRRLAEVFVRTARKVSEYRNHVKFITPLATDEIGEFFTGTVKKVAPHLPIQFIDREARNVISAADVVLLASGTAALETALLKKPFAVAYRLSGLSYVLIKLLGTVRHYSVVNHLGKEPVIPEFMQSDCTDDNLSRELIRLLDDAPYRERILDQFEKFRGMLRCGANEKAVDEIMKFLIR